MSGRLGCDGRIVAASIVFNKEHVLKHTRQKHLHVQNKRGASPKEAQEVLIINGTSFA